MEIRWAICGLGKISLKFLNAIKMSKNSKVVACASSSRKRAEIYANKHNIKLFGTYEEIASSNEIDAVYICNNTSDHYKSSLIFLKHKIPVLCEKPFTQNYEEAAHLIEYAKKQNTLIMEGMWIRFLPSTKKILDIVNSKMLGEVTSIEGVFNINFRFNKKNRVFDHKRGGGSILDLGVYLASYAHFILGFPHHIEAEGKVENNIDLKSKFTFKYSNMIKAVFNTSIINFFRMNIKIYFEKGVLKIPRFTTAIKFKLKTANKNKKYKFKFKNGFQYEIDHFADLISNNQKESPLRTYKDTLEIMKILQIINKQLGLEFGEN